MAALTVPLSVLLPVFLRPRGRVVATSRITSTLSCYSEPLGAKMRVVSLKDVRRGLPSQSL
eukprot:1433120-Alexandrium_andersonii.AAC.1